MDRRSFLKTGLGLTAALLGPGDGLHAEAVRRRVLVLLELKGGNDSLNAFVPYADPAYHAARPTLAIGRDVVVRLDERIGLNPALEALLPAWQRNELALVQGVGYPAPNRSHFRSIEIWDTGSASNEYLDSGWLARAIGRADDRQNADVDAIVLGKNAAPLLGNRLHTVVMKDSRSFIRNARRMRADGATSTNPSLAHILAVQREIDGAANALSKRLKSQAPPGGFPKTPIGQSLREAARIILAGLEVSAIKVEHGSFDTHFNQRRRHDALLRQLAGALAAFRDSLLAQGRWDEVMVMSYSEFGRRVAENGSKGTDHGTAATHFLLGGGVRGGLFGEMPSLARLDAGDLHFRVDYRRLYNSALSEWLGRPALYPTSTYPMLGIVRS